MAFPRESSEAQMMLRPFRIDLQPATGTRRKVDMSVLTRALTEVTVFDIKRRRYVNRIRKT